jgi:hypothetical protein
VKNFVGTYVHLLLGFNLYSFSSIALEFFTRHFLTILRFLFCAEREREREKHTHTHKQRERQRQTHRYRDREGNKRFGTRISATMEWFKKQIGVGAGGNDGLASFIVGSDKWMGSTAKYNKEDEASTSYYQPPPLQDKQLQSSSSSSSWKSNRTNAAPPVSEDVLSATLKSHSMGESLVKYPTIDATYATPWRTDAASGQLVAEEPASATPLRSQSMGGSLREVRYPTVDPYAPDSSDARVMNSSSHLEKLSFYPEIYQGGEQQQEEGQLFEADVPPGKEEEVESREECLVTVPGAIVYLIDDEQSVHLATAHFSIVRITQKGNGIVVLVRVGNDLHWPLMKDVPAVKLDPTHYFFSVPVPLVVDHTEEDTKNSKHNVSKQSFCQLQFSAFIVHLRLKLVSSSGDQKNS